MAIRNTEHACGGAILVQASEADFLLNELRLDDSTVL